MKLDKEREQVRQDSYAAYGGGGNQQNSNPNVIRRQQAALQKQSQQRRKSGNGGGTIQVKSMGLGENMEFVQAHGSREKFQGKGNHRF